MLKIKDLHVYHGYVQAIRGVSLHVKQNKLLAIIGANGAGKSTLLGTIAGLNQPTQGTILIKHQDAKQGTSPKGSVKTELWQTVTGFTPEKMVRQGVSLVPERREIFNSMTVRDNLMLGAYHRYRRHKASLNQDLQQVLDIFPALKGREKELAGTLSGGLQQMLAVGRALMARPKLLLLDEPSVGLAPLVVREIMATLAGLKNTGVTIVLVEQNTKAALQVADYALVMERGQITMDGEPQELLTNDHVQQAYLGRAKVKTAVAMGR